MQAAFVLRCYRLLALLGLCLALMIPVATASAATSDMVPCVSPVQPGDNLEKLLADPARFDCTSPQSEMKPGDYWVRMDVSEATQKAAGPRPLLRIASLWDDGLSLSTIHRDGSVTRYSADLLKQKMKPRLGATMVLTLAPDKPPVTTLVAKVNDSKIIRGVLTAPQLTGGEEAIRFEMAMAVVYAGFGGLCIAMLVYTAALWRAMRETFLLAYCAMVSAMAVYAFFTCGAIHYLADGWTGSDRLHLTIPLLAISGATALIFVRHFFAVSRIPVWLVRITYAQAIGMSVFAIVYSLVAPRYIATLDHIYLLGFVPLPFIIGAYLWTAAQQRDPLLRYFIIAWSAPVVAAALRILHGFGVLPYHVLIENSTLIAFAFEALINSLAIGQRVWLMAQARDRAESAEASALMVADTDPLTGLLNRRAFLRKMLDRPGNWNLILLDVDHFKRVNDTLGHAGGDDAIISIAATMRANAPDGALIARMGGEEFAISYGSQVAGQWDPDQLLCDVRTIDLPDGYRITASVGIASRPVENENDWKILYRAADMALYQAKSSGRDCFVRLVPERAAA